MITAIEALQCRLDRDQGLGDAAAQRIGQQKEAQASQQQAQPVDQQMTIVAQRKAKGLGFNCQPFGVRTA